MEQAEQLLREWCERHPGWDWCSRDGAFEWSQSFHLVGPTQRFGRVFAWYQGSTVEQDYRAFEAAKQLIFAAEHWIEANANEGGCTPTRR